MNIKNLYRGAMAAIERFHWKTSKGDLDLLRKVAKPNYVFAILCFILGLWNLYGLKNTHIVVEIEGQHVVTLEGVKTLVLFYIGIRNILGSPTNRLLLKLAEKHEEAEKEK
jgi:hypothetical protein